MSDKAPSIGPTPGLWLGAGASILIAALVFHGPPDADPLAQMQNIAEGHLRWALVHWAAAAALFLISGAGFLNLVDQGAGGSPAIVRSAWLVVALGALMTVSTAVSEASVVAVAAHAGDEAAFVSWWAFSGGMANGFFALALASAFIASVEGRSDASIMPRWSSVAGTIFGLFSAAGWSLGEQLGFEIGGPIWLISTMLMCIWLAWFGFAAMAVTRHKPLPQPA
jgi:hypothetical protein